MEIDALFAERLLGKEAPAEHKTLAAALMAAAREGHLCLPLEDGKCALPHEEVAEERAPTQPFCRFGSLLYLQRNWVTETRFVQQARRLVESGSLSLLTGGPGTGKTYTAARLVQALPENSRVVLAAPTGKAAARLEESVRRQGSFTHSLECGTLHKVLAIRSRVELQEESSPLLADLVIVDECSMIDAALFVRLLTSVRIGTSLVLMGDSDQLPPVEGGSFFADLVDAAQRGWPVPCTRLTTCYRSEQKEILEIAASLNRGEVVPSAPLEGVPYAFPSCNGPSPDMLSLFDRFRILSCVRGGPYGVDAVNARLYAQHAAEASAWLAVPIIITRNDPRQNLYNGDTGVLFRNLQGEEESAWFPRRNEPVPAVLLPAYEYAYCLSVHKSQGSEYDHVCLLVPPGSEAFGKEVLYTGATRARRSLAIFGAPETLEQAVRKTARRRSSVPFRLDYSLA
jgi:exodeoxyribonuclease V alpha subunit